MKSLKLATTILMCLSTLCQIGGTESIDVTYEEFSDLNATCFPVNNCSAHSRYFKECTCDIFCTRYGTCCVDSPYRNMPKPSIMATCRRVGAPTSMYGYFIIDQCPQNEDSQSAYEDLCRGEWDGENDIMRLVPVTSLFTHITYKNYFCFKCNEANDDFVFWIVQTEYEGQSPVEENTHVQLEFDKHRNSWVAPIGKTGAFIPLSFPVFDVPLDIFGVPKRCWFDGTSKCSEYWEDDTVRAKCDAYMSVTFINRDGNTYEYRNPHCAICNFEDLNNVVCRRPVGAGGFGGGSGGSEGFGGVSPGVFVVGSGGYEGFGGGPRRPPFSFALLLDFNPSDGKIVGKIQKCPSGDAWDPFFKKCRTLTCAVPGYVAKDGKCRAP